MVFVCLSCFQWQRNQYCGYLNQISDISGSRLCVSVGIDVLTIATDKWPTGKTAARMTLSGYCFKQAVFCLVQLYCPFSGQNESQAENVVKNYTGAFA